MSAYAGLIGSLGLAFLLQTAYLLPLTAAILTLAVGGLAVGAPRRRGYGPFLVGWAAATLLLVGKFAMSSLPAVSAGIVLLFLVPRQPSIVRC
jgi:hypothetical protein